MNFDHYVMLNPDFPSQSPPTLDSLSSIISSEKFLDVAAKAFGGRIYLRASSMPEPPSSDWYEIVVEAIRTNFHDDGIEEFFEALLKVSEINSEALLAVFSARFPHLERRFSGFLMTAEPEIATENPEAAAKRIANEIHQQATAEAQTLPQSGAARKAIGMAQGGVILTYTITGQSEATIDRVRTLLLDHDLVAVIDENDTYTGIERRFLVRATGTLKESLKQLAIETLGAEFLSSAVKGGAVVVLFDTDPEIIAGAEKILEQEGYHIAQRKEGRSRDFYGIRFSFQKGPKPIRIAPTYVPETEIAPSEIETLAFNLSPVNIIRFQILIKTWALLDFVITHRLDTEKVLEVLDVILESRNLFESDVYGNYVEQLRHNFVNLRAGGKIREDLEDGLPRLG